MSRPPRDSRRTTSPCLQTRQRKASYFSSKIQPGAENSLPVVASIKSRWQIEGGRSRRSDISGKLQRLLQGRADYMGAPGRLTKGLRAMAVAMIYPEPAKVKRKG